MWLTWLPRGWTVILLCLIASGSLASGNTPLLCCSLLEGLWSHDPSDRSDLWFLKKKLGMSNPVPFSLVSSWTTPNMEQRRLSHGQSGPRPTLPVTRWLNLSNSRCEYQGFRRPANVSHLPISTFLGNKCGILVLPSPSIFTFLN